MIPNEPKPIEAEHLNEMPAGLRTGFPVRYRQLNLRNVVVTKENSEAIIACKEWAAGRVENLFLWGPQGTGKTHYACAAIGESVYQSAEFILVPEMLLKFQASVQEHGELDMIAEYLKSSRKGFYGQEKSAHIFDDVGAHRVSDFSIEMFGLLLEKYYSYCWRGLLFTSNLSPRKIRDTMGERVSSRLMGLCRDIEISGDDKRLKRA